MHPLYIAVMLDARREELAQTRRAHQPISRRRAWFGSRRRAAP